MFPVGCLLFFHSICLFCLCGCLFLGLGFYILFLLSFLLVHGWHPGNVFGDEKSREMIVWADIWVCLVNRCNWQCYIQEWQLGNHSRKQISWQEIELWDNGPWGQNWGYLKGHRQNETLNGFYHKTQCCYELRRKIGIPGVELFVAGNFVTGNQQNANRDVIYKILWQGTSFLAVGFNL